MEQGEILWLAVNAKYSHTSLAVRYLRECVPGSSILELTINHQLLAALGRGARQQEMNPRTQRTQTNRGIKKQLTEACNLTATAPRHQGNHRLVLR